MLLKAFLSLLVIPICCQSYFNFDGFLDLNNGQEPQTAPKRIYTEVLDVKITAQSALAVDAHSGKVLYKKNPQEIRSIASITKLMTALVFLDNNPGWQKKFHTIASDRRNGGIIHLNTGEVLTIRNLFFTALIASDNDATVALARSTGLSEKDFIKAMNKKASSLGLNNTIFIEPSGLHDGNKSTAEDIAKLVQVAISDQFIKEATSTNRYEFEVQAKEEAKRKVSLVNTDWLTNSYLHVLGGKTGYIEKSGYCLAVKLKNETDQKIIVVVLGSASNFDRFQDVKAISDWVFTNYQWN
jgi:D-alanyl-D-alanine carboxypeptidase